VSVVRFISLLDVLKRYPSVTKTERVKAVSIIRQITAAYHSKAWDATLSEISDSARNRKISDKTAKNPSIAVTVADNLNFLMAKHFMIQLPGQLSCNKNHKLMFFN
jgi:hypothetical protein